MAKRFLSYLWIPLLLAWELVLQPIWNLNVEAIATSNGLNDELEDATQQIDPSGVAQLFWDWVSFFTGNFLWGAVTVGSMYFVVDMITWLRRRSTAKSEVKQRGEPLSSVYSDALSLEKHLRHGVGLEEYRRNVSLTKQIPLGISSKVRSFFAQLHGFNISTPVISRDMTVKEAKVVLDFLAIAMPFIGKSQVEQLRSEALLFVPRAAQE